MKLFNKLQYFGIIFMVAALLACQIKEQDSPQRSRKSDVRSSHKIKVLTSIAPLYSFTKNIAGDMADVDNLLPSGAGPHEYSLSPEDVRKVVEARILVINGVNLEAWLHNLVTAAEELGGSSRSDSEKLIVVDTSDGVDLIDKDPHIWLSPRNAIIQVINIREALAKADPGNSEAYLTNAAEYIRRLENLDGEIRDEIKSWKSNKFVAFHSAFNYFARDYGLEQVAVIQETPEIEPSPKHIAYVIETIKSKGIKSIFTEPQFSHRIVRSIAGDLGLEVYSLDTLETGSLSKEWYENSMRTNLSVLKRALNR